jgi:hypothetical protein
MINTVEPAQALGKYRSKDECPQCHVRIFKLLEEAEPCKNAITKYVDNTGKKAGVKISKQNDLECELCHKSTCVLHLVVTQESEELLACGVCVQLVDEVRSFTNFLS